MGPPGVPRTWGEVVTAPAGVRPRGCVQGPVSPQVPEPGTPGLWHLQSPPGRELVWVILPVSCC